MKISIFCFLLAMIAYSIPALRATVLWARVPLRQAARCRFA
jgi:hypothetical protein